MTGKGFFACLARSVRLGSVCCARAPERDTAMSRAIITTPARKRPVARTDVRGPSRSRRFEPGLRLVEEAPLLVHLHLEHDLAALLVGRFPCAHRCVARQKRTDTEEHIHQPRCQQRFHRLSSAKNSRGPGGGPGILRQTLEGGYGTLGQYGVEEVH